ncbi:MAG: hypothetical protein ACKO9Z_05325, partial [Planctomycetota bacterium]
DQGTTPGAIAETKEPRTQARSAGVSGSIPDPNPLIPPSTAFGALLVLLTEHLCLFCQRQQFNSSI